MQVYAAAATVALVVLSGPVASLEREQNPIGNVDQQSSKQQDMSAVPLHKQDVSQLEGAGLANKFFEWAKHHEKPYLKTKDFSEYLRRLEVFKNNVEYINDFNSKSNSVKLGLTSLADLTHEEYRQHYLGFHGKRAEKKRQNKANAHTRTQTSTLTDAEDLPERVDWVEEGKVTNVKNQAMCGSCWAFSATGAVESINAIKTGKLVELSEQELVDCDPSDEGCSGGLMDNAFEFVLENGGIDTEEDYQYIGQDEACDPNKQGKHFVRIDDRVDVPTDNELELKKAVAQQPVSVAIEADTRAFQMYVDGVFDAVCGDMLDHGVLAVGYGQTDAGEKYWLVKNSWGPFWGDGGYIKMNRTDSTDSEGICGIAHMAAYPTMKDGPYPSPPPPGPAPPPSPSGDEVKCNALFSCPADNTCCCRKEVVNRCLAFSCCPYPEASCCDDGVHCCPKEYPVCLVDMGLCSKEQADGQKPKDSMTMPMPDANQSPMTSALGFLDLLHFGRLHE